MLPVGDRSNGWDDAGGIDSTNREPSLRPGTGAVGRPAARPTGGGTARRAADGSKVVPLDI